MAANTQPEEVKPAPTPAPGTRIDFRQPNPAELELAILAKEEEGKKDQGRIKDDSEWQYFQKCYRGHAAFFYVGNPLNKIVQENDWHSKYKRPDEPWRGNVICQECTTYDAEGYPLIEFPAMVSAYLTSHRQPTRFMPDPTWVYRYPKEAKRRKEIPPHRAAIIDISAGNVGSLNPDIPDRVKNVRDGRREFAGRG